MLTGEDQCYYCKHPEKHKCKEKCDCVENYPPHECCEDNLKKNVGEICFKYNVPQNVAVAIIKILEKERERNECMYVHRQHIEDRRTDEDTDYLFS